jgi:hypothetical protein
MFIVTGLSNLLRLFWPKRPNPYVTVFLQSLTVTSWALLATVSVQQLSVIVTGILTLAAVVSVLRTPK